MSAVPSSYDIPMTDNGGNQISPADIAASVSQQGNNMALPTYDELSAYPTSGAAGSSTADTAQALANAQDTGVAMPVGLGNYGGYTTGSTGNATDDSSKLLAQGNYLSQGASGTSGGLMDSLGQVNKWANDNKSNPLLYAALAGIGSAQKSEQLKQAAAQLQADKLATLDHESQIAKDKIAANSASVSGLRPVQGIIASQLTHLNGTPVYQANGRIA